MDTVEPTESRPPGPGAWAATRPSTFLSSVGWNVTWIWNPAAWSFEIALPWASPTTFGTPAAGGLPVETWMATWVPETAVEPPAGDWPTTTPAGRAEGADWTSGVKWESTRT